MQKDTAILEKEVKQAIIETTLPETSVPQQKVESSLSGISPESPIKEVKTVDNLEGPPQVQLILTAITNLSLMIEKVNENLNLQNVLLKELISKDHYNPKLNIELNAHPKDQDQSLQLSKSIISKEIPSEKSNEVQNTDKSNISPEPKKTGFMCEICGEYFNSLELRIRHAQKERHLVTGAYECKKCDKKFTLELQYDQHCMSKKH
jgi:DNA-directed RNA polymerase subunit M/transcription elongation factor TFIIS